MTHATEPVPRSAFVTGLAWTFIGLSGFATLIALMQNAMIFLIFPLDEVRTAMKETDEARAMPAPFRFMFEYMWLMFVFFLVISVATLVSAIGLLKRRNWARLVFIGIMVLGILWNVASFAMPYLMGGWMTMPEHTPPGFADQFDLMWKIMTVFSVLMGVAFIALFAWIIKRLVSPGIRAEFAARRR